MSKHKQELPVMRTSRNYIYDADYSSEKVSSKSKTRPNMTYTPQELIMRYQKGMPMPKLSGYSYHDMPDPRTMDMTEQAELMQATAFDIKQKEKELQEKQRARKEKNSENVKQYHEFLEYQRQKRASDSVQNEQNKGANTGNSNM